MKTIAVVGASGFVGATFVERMMSREDVRLRPFIRSSGNAWRLARHGSLELETLDLLSETETQKALEGCTHVVNCSRGNPEVMGLGLDNLLKAAQTAGVQRFVHLSSVCGVRRAPASAEYSRRAHRPSPRKARTVGSNWTRTDAFKRLRRLDFPRRSCVLLIFLAPTPPT